MKKTKSSKKNKKPAPWNLKTQVKGALRRLSSRTPAHKECMDNAIHLTIKGPRGGKQYICACCKKTFSAINVQVDHIEEVIPVNRSIDEMTWDEIINRIFCDISLLQVLCKPCHKIKTSKERKARKKYRDSKKSKDL